MKKNIICKRCGKREGFGKCHEKINFKNEVFHLCVDCAQVAYKIKDAVVDKDNDLANKLVCDFTSHIEKSNEILLNWFDEYKTRIGFSPNDPNLALRS